MLGFTRLIRGRAGLLAGVALCGGLLLCGCTDGHGPMLSVSDSTQSMATEEPNARADPTGHGGGKRIVLDHDFGLLRPGEKVRHVFTIENKGIRKWTIGRVTSGCSCAIANLPSPIVPPGGELQAEVLYTAKGSWNDSRERVVLSFQEAEVAPVTLVVRANVRAAMTSKPAEVNFGSLVAGSTGRRQFEIQNFSDSDWSDVSLASCPDWIKARHFRVNVVSPAGDKVGPRQIWRFVLTARTAGLERGGHMSQILVKTCDDEEATATVIVAVFAAARVRISPSHLFFGRLSLGEATTKDVLFTFHPESVPANFEAVRIEHTLAQQLQIEWNRLTTTMWRLRATLHATSSGHINEQMRIEFQDTDLSGVTLPLHAWVESS